MTRSSSAKAPSTSLAAIFSRALQQERGGEVRRRAQGIVERRLRLGVVALLGVGCRQGCLQFRRRRRLGEYWIAAVVLDRSLRLALLDQGADQKRQHGLLRILEVERLAQLDFARHGVAVLQERAAEQKARLRQVGLLLQRALQLDHRRAAVLLGEDSPSPTRPAPPAAPRLQPARSSPASASDKARLRRMLFTSGRRFGVEKARLTA